MGLGAGLVSFLQLFNKVQAMAKQVSF